MRQIGLIGLAAMGRNLARNLARNGMAVTLYNRTTQVTKDILDHFPEAHFRGAETLAELVEGLDPPRLVWLMVSAGKGTDAVLDQLRPLLKGGDIVVDGGNAHFVDTERRFVDFARQGIHFYGIGVSGGEEGALRGPSMMPGGEAGVYAWLEPVLEAIAGRASDGKPCVAYLGKGGAGHFVKMVHNGIEYAIMQAIAETYDLLVRLTKLPAGELAGIYDGWNAGRLRSFLVEITAKVLKVRDEQSGEALVNKILDQAAQKGTGQWTSQEALTVGVPVPAITTAVEARVLSALKEERVRAQSLLQGPRPDQLPADDLVPALDDALWGCFITAYAQGFTLLQNAVSTHGYDLPLGEVARIWRAGCIIRSEMLEDIYRAYQIDPALPNLLVGEPFIQPLASIQPGWRKAVTLGVQHGVPLPVMSASLAYYDGYRSARLPANLIQAQRDYFGAHTYQRVDQEGTFHTDWD